MGRADRASQGGSRPAPHREISPCAALSPPLLSPLPSSPPLLQVSSTGCGPSFHRSGTLRRPFRPTHRRQRKAAGQIPSAGAIMVHSHRAMRTMEVAEWTRSVCVTLAHEPNRRPWSWRARKRKRRTRRASSTVAPSRSAALWNSRRAARADSVRNAPRVGRGSRDSVSTGKSGAHPPIGAGPLHGLRRGSGGIWS